LKLIY